MSRAFRIAVSCALAAHAVNARAQPRTDPTAGRAVFTGATSPNATSIELNPAALDLGKADEIYVAATSVIDQLSIQTRTENLMTGTLSPGTDVSPTTLAPGGTVAYIGHLQRIATLAVDVSTTPIAAAPSGIAALQYHELALRERSYSGAIAASVRLADSVLFGASISDSLHHLHLRYARDTAIAAGHGPLADPNDTEIVDVNVHQTSLFSSDNLSVNLGLVIKDFPVKDLFIGVAYHTVPGVDSVTNAYTGNMVVQQADGAIARGGAEVIVSEPASFDGEIRYRLHDLDLLGGVRWEDLSRFSAYDVRGYGTALTEIGDPEWTVRPLGYHDGLAGWLGVEQVDLGDLAWHGLTWGARAGVQSSALPDAATSPLAIAPRSYTGDLGVQLRVPDSPVVMQLTYGVQYFPTVHVANSAFDPRDAIDCVASGYDYSTPACASTRNGYAIDTAAGDYSRWEHAIRFSLRYEL